MMWQALAPTLDAVTVNHYLEGGMVVGLGFTAKMLRDVWQDLKGQVRDHEHRIVQLEVSTGVSPDRRRLTTEGSE